MWAVLIASWLSGAVLAIQWGWDSTQTFAAGSVAALGVYLLLCLFRPYKPCPSCSGDDRLRDGEGNYRRFECWRCGGARDYPRIGARLMGRGRR